MRDVEVSCKTRELLDAAKRDGPGALAKAKIWGGIAATTAAAAGAGAGAGAGAAAVAGGSGKLVAVGALFGSAVTVGLAVALIRVGSSPAPAPPPSPPVAAVAPAPPAAVPETTIDLPATPDGVTTIDLPATPDTATPNAPLAAPPATAGAGNAASTSPVAKKGSAAPAQRSAGGDARRAKGAGSDDVLMRETLLVAEARGALMRGDPQSALTTVRAARATGSRALEPEELALEAKALRALGKEAEAGAAESLLRTRYPDHALAR